MTVNKIVSTIICGVIICVLCVCVVFSNLSQTELINMPIFSVWWLQFILSTDKKHRKRTKHEANGIARKWNICNSFVWLLGIRQVQLRFTLQKCQYIRTLVWCGSAHKTFASERNRNPLAITMAVFVRRFGCTCIHIDEFALSPSRIFKEMKYFIGEKTRGTVIRMTMPMLIMTMLQNTRQFTCAECVWKTWSQNWYFDCFQLIRSISISLSLSVSPFHTLCQSVSCLFPSFLLYYCRQVLRIAIGSFGSREHTSLI